MDQLGSCFKSNLSETMHVREFKDDGVETLFKPFHLELVFFPVSHLQIRLSQGPFPLSWLRTAVRDFCFTHALLIQNGKEQSFRQLKYGMSLASGSESAYKHCCLSCKDTETIITLCFSSSRLSLFLVSYAHMYSWVQKTYNASQPKKNYMVVDIGKHRSLQN